MMPVAAAASASSGATSASDSGAADELNGPASTVSMISPASQNKAAALSHRYPLATGPLCRVAPTHKLTTAPAIASMPRTLTVGSP